MTDKTFKREVAVALAIFMCMIAWKAAEVQPLETLKVIIWPIMLFVGAAYGMSWASKQTGLAGGGK
jgi:di/tricarboxylate transporter